VNGRSAVVAGATGLVGGLLLEDLLLSAEYSRVTVVVRRRLPRAPTKLHQVVVEDFARLSDAGRALAADDAFCCLGTTRARAGSAEAFRRVDFDAVLAFARAALAAGARRFLLVSSSGADARSPFLYPRVKGEADEAVAALPFEGVAILRPSLLLGARAETRPLERLAQIALGPLRPLFAGPLRRARPIEAAVVARAMLRQALRREAGARILENERLEELGAL
jgi:uncharacterized protein YbjT (DUF2867 family)